MSYQFVNKQRVRSFSTALVFREPLGDSLTGANSSDRNAGLASLYIRDSGCRAGPPWIPSSVRNP
jgi:hypothetical protein